jgi:hypothetical protein
MRRWGSVTQQRYSVGYTAHAALQMLHCTCCTARTNSPLHPLHPPSHPPPVTKLAAPCANTVFIRLHVGGTPGGNQRIDVEYSPYGWMDLASGIGGVKFCFESFWLLLSSLLMGGGLAGCIMSATDKFQPAWPEGEGNGHAGAVSCILYSYSTHTPLILHSYSTHTPHSYTPLVLHACSTRTSILYTLYTTLHYTSCPLTLSLPPCSCGR